MIKKIYENNLAFYEMVKITTYLSNSVNDEYITDAGRIIEFIGKSYGFNDELIAYCKKQILEELSLIATDEDVRTFQSLKQEERPQIDVTNPLLKFKYNALNEIFNIDYRQTQLNKVWFDYSYPNDYNGMIRFSELSISSSSGIIDINKAVAIMYYLGIGTEKDDEAAIRKFKQCMYWGDIASIHFLAFIAKENGNKEQEKLYSELVELSNYLNEGITVLPQEAKDKYDKSTVDIFVLITSIKHDIIRRFNVGLIDYSFTEIMIDQKVNYFKKLAYINSYRTLDWADETNSAADAAPRMGFKVED